MYMRCSGPAPTKDCGALLSRRVRLPVAATITDNVIEEVVAIVQQTLLCTYPSGVLLVGLALNSVLWWATADPSAASSSPALPSRTGCESSGGEHCC
jgi:hypothetical protein